MDRMTIGQFSRRCGLSPKVLRSYAKLGVLVPAAIDPVSGYRYYTPAQVAEAEVVVLLRRLGVAVADIERFLREPSAEELDGWERLLAAEVHSRREALAEVRGRLDLEWSRRKGATVVEIREIRDRIELAEVFDLVGAQLAPPITVEDERRFGDLDAHFPDDQPLMVLARTDEGGVGGALAFRNEDGWATLRIVVVVEGFRHRGIGRRLVERVETEARRLGVEGIALGTDEAVGFWCHLGYTPNLLVQWVYDAERCEAESRALLEGPLAGLRHWRSSFRVPQLFVELDEPRLNLRHALSDSGSGYHVGFMMSKPLAVAPRTA